MTTAALVLLFFLRSFGYAENESFHKGCKLKNTQFTFDALPGRGWDNLINKEMGRVLAVNFSKCRFSDDSVYLIPNDVSLIATKASVVDLFSEVIDHFQNHTSLTARSVNMNAEGPLSAWSIGGSFSLEKMQIKNEQIETKSKLVRVQLRYDVFHSMSEPDSQLDMTFKNRILDIASLVMEHKDSLYPSYLADLIVRDFGTHVIRTIYAGAILAKTDALTSDYVKKHKEDTMTISTSAVASFKEIFSLKLKVGTTDSKVNLDEFHNNSLKTHVETFGGSLFGSNFTVLEWEKSVLKNLVPIDRQGDPIYYVITTRSLPELDEYTVEQVSKLVEEAVKRYYKANVIEGCMNIKSPNFNSDANVDNGKCEHSKVNFTFGGVYQTCIGPDHHCNDIRQANPLTNRFACPSKYDSVLLMNSLYKCENKQCSFYYTYWCAPVKAGIKADGYQFGGVISKDMRSCPLEYIPLKLGLSTRICVTNIGQKRDVNDVGFGGFFSCSAGNPLAREYPNPSVSSSKGNMERLHYWAKKCPNGYVAHILIIERNCQISYCSETNKVSRGSHATPYRPPFIEINFNPNSTKPRIIFNNQGEKFYRDNEGVWKQYDGNRGVNVIVCFVLGSIFAVIISCTIMFLLQRRHYLKKMRDCMSADGDKVKGVPISSDATA